MSAEPGQARLDRAARPAATFPVSRRRWGLRSILAKTVRDARWAILAVGGLNVVVMLLAGSLMATEFATAASRVELRLMSTSLPPIFKGLLGQPIAVDTLGGFISWRFGGFLAVYGGLWSILALSGTLAGESGRGSLELLVAAPRSRRRIALEKLAVHAISLGIAALAGALGLWVTGLAFGTLPGDEIALGAAVSQMLLFWLQSLAAGSVAFALGPLAGRSVAAGIAGIALFGGYMATGFAALAPGLDAVSVASWFRWTAGVRPLIGLYDGPALALLALVVTALLTVGVVAFERGDLGRTASLSLGLPRATHGLSDPAARSLGDRLPAALSWGGGIALFAWTMAVSSEGLAHALAQSPALVGLMRFALPGIDPTTPAGFLELVYFDAGMILTGLAAATLLAGWASDETDGRLEAVLANPVGRARWAVQSGLGVFAALAVVAALNGFGIALGTAAVGGDPTTPTLGAAALGLYGLGLAGLGLAAAGVVRAPLAAPLVALVAIVSQLLDFLVPVLRLPDWLAELTLSGHFGRPLIGRWETFGPVAAAVLAVGGLAIAAWGFARRDVGR